MDAVLSEGEKRSDLLREAVEKELKRRERQKPASCRGWRVTDLLRLKHLAFVDSFEGDGKLIVQAKSRRHSEPYGCCLLFSFSKMGTKASAIATTPSRVCRRGWRFKRQRFRCNTCGKVGYENLPDIDTERRITKRFREHLQRDGDQVPVHDGRRDQRRSRETLVRRVFDEHAKRVLGKYKPMLPRVLGMDEIYLHRKPRFVVGDVENSLMLDMQESRRLLNLNAYFETLEGRDRVEVVCQDMWRNYRTVSRAMFPEGRHRHRQVTTSSARPTTPSRWCARRCIST